MSHRKQSPDLTGSGSSLETRSVQESGKKRRTVTKTNHAAVAKIASPVLSAVYPRTRLFRLLDKARQRPIVWLSAPGGFGKTTLIASYLQARKLPTLWYQVDASDGDAASFFYYMGLAAKSTAPRYRNSLPLLTPEYRNGLPAFSANYFRDLFKRLKRPSVIVLDNYQEVGADDKLQEVLRQGLDQIPAKINVIVISREDPPCAVARARASNQIALLDWEALKLTEQESAAIVKLRCKKAVLTRETLRHLYQDTQGWVAGIVLLTEEPSGNIQHRDHPLATSRQAIFDYFANEAFRQGEPHVQQFLVKTAFLPKVSPALAAELTGDRASETILQSLAKRNLFTMQRAEGSFEYHPLFRAFLVNHAKQIHSHEQIQELKRRSAQLLAQRGDIETAVTLLQEAEGWAEALGLVLAHASALVGQGRTQTLELWLNTVPEPLREENGWVLYWLGVCRLGFAPREARAYFERAFALFEKQNDASPLYLTWSGIIESFVYEWNAFAPMLHWLDLYASLKTNRAPPDPEIEASSIFAYISGLILARFGDPDLERYVARAEHIFRQETNVDRRFTQAMVLARYYLWRGDANRLGYLLDALEPHVSASGAKPLARLSWYTWKTLYAGSVCRPEESMRAAKDGLALSDATGIHLLDLQLLGYAIWGQLCCGYTERARALLEQMGPRMHGWCISEILYCHSAANVLVHEGNVDQAIHYGRKAVQLAQKASLFIGEVSYAIGLAFALTNKGETTEALRVIAETRPKAICMKSNLFVSYCELAEANARRVRGEYDLCVARLEEGLRSARQVGGFPPAYCVRDDLAHLYAIALEAGIEVDYVRETIGRARLKPPRELLPERWPWPVRLYTLGQFAIVKDNAPLSFSRKGQKKPLDLLRVLVAFGGRNVPIVKIANELWPETDGDMARRAVETTVHRLRRLLGEASILRQESLLTLNPEHCWLDVSAFELLLTTAGATPARRLERLLALYRGGFAEDEDAPQVAVHREKLRSKFIAAVVDLGEALEREGRYQEAINGYQKAIDAEPFSEALFLRLMRCYRCLDRSAEALAVYQRCHTNLTSVLRVEPSTETKALYREIYQST